MVHIASMKPDYPLTVVFYKSDAGKEPVRIWLNLKKQVIYKENEMTHKNIGSNFDDFLQEEGILAETDAAAVKRVVAYQIQQLMAEKKMTKTNMAKKMGTSRSSLNRLLDPANMSVSLKTLEKAANSLGRKLTVQLV
ncbi:MAG: helix-turn-helix transcriptional regulator [Desulfobacterales bacterium]